MSLKKLIPCVVNKNDDQGKYCRVTDATVYVDDVNIAHCITALEPRLSVHHANMVIEQRERERERELFMSDDKTIVVGHLEHYSAMDLGNRVYSVDGISPACCSHAGDTLAKFMIKGGDMTKYGYRIRKLTPYECFILMGVEPEDAKKMLSVNSNSQCYKQAGNSIVVDVMAAMFKKLID